MTEIANEVNGGDSQDLHSLLSSPARNFLVRNNGEQVKIDSLKGKKIGFYFSAAWCGQCQEFTPQLVEVYNELSPKVGFEIVFVSGDEDETSFSDYFSKMPWLAVPFTDSETCDRLDDLFKVRGIPTLVMVDDHGKIVNENGVGFIRSYGADAYPFTPERMKEIKEEEDRARKDRLSNLPNHLLCLILSKLPTKDSVRTSVLSEQWRNLWLHVPALDLDTTNFRDYYKFLDFTDSFMESNKELDIDIERFKLKYDLDEHVHFVWRISKVLKRRVRHLTIMSGFVLRMPPSIYSCASLVNLSLNNVGMDNPESELVYLPCVKTMSLDGVKFNDNSILETLISNCPVLEDLVIITYHSDDLEVVCVRSQSLKSVKLNSQLEEGDPVFEIDAPRLEYMSISNYECEECIIHRIGPSTKVNIDVVSYLEILDPLEITRIRDFIIGLSKVREMRISASSLEVIHDFSNMEPLPQFTNLSFLNALLMGSSWEVLATFLGCCINLQSLFVKLDDNFFDIMEIEVSPVPQCFRSSLKFVTLETLTQGSETPSTRKLADYFRQNCSDLKELVLR